jgi:hypothetical protein
VKVLLPRKTVRFGPFEVVTMYSILNPNMIDSDNRYLKSIEGLRIFSIRKELFRNVTSEEFGDK